MARQLAAAKRSASNPIDSEVRIAAETTGVPRRHSTSSQAAPSPIVGRRPQQVAESNDEPQLNNEATLAERWSAAEPVIAAYISGEIRARHDAEDVLQDVCRAIVQGLERYDPERPFVNWAFGVARNQVLRYYHRQARDRRILSAPLVEMLADACRNLQPRLNERAEALQDCLARLPARQLEAVGLFYRDELPQGEVAARLGLSKSAVGVLIHRARLALKTCITNKLQSPN
jgi:RNA polymerase sigma-70 factor (ECF subfamily)